jgi:SAM-dependent methyltransferase
VLSSQMCRREQLDSPPFRRWAERMRPAWDQANTGVPVFVHRKLWEWLFIAEALRERGRLREGMRGLGFGVGQEPLASLFASLGCTIVATDMAHDQAERAGWTVEEQFAGDLALLNKHGMCDEDLFRERVSYRTVDMNAVPDDLRGFDFTWSSCSFEHLGSIDRGLAFVKEQMKCLRRGGVAVHTTEYNVGSNRETIDHEATVLFRRRDFRRLARSLYRHGHRIRLDFRPGTLPDDEHVDASPYSSVHLRTAILGYTTTSFGLIIRKGPF